LRIVKLSAENFKRLRAVEITPEGNLVEIRGPNGAGKSSCLDAIWSALGGVKVTPQKPIRRGAENARIELDLGEIIVTRKFTAAGSSLTVEAASGARFPSPQRMLDDLIGAIAFDPLEFTRMKPAEQLETLRGLVHLDVDLDALDGARQRDYEARTDVNREATRLRGQATALNYPEGLPEEPIDVTAMIARVRAAGEENADLERRKARREQTAQNLDAKRQRVAVLHQQAAALIREAEGLEREADEAAKQLADAPPLPEPVDTTALVAEIETARQTNAHIDARTRRQTIEAEADALEKRSRELTEAIETRLEQRRAAIANAKMPVDGLAFGDGEVLFDGLPLDQASQAEKIRVSVAIAMSANPRVRVLCVRDGSLLDQDSMRVIAEMIGKADYQLWLEVTTNADDGVGVVIEDGAVKPRVAEQAQPGLALEV